MPTEFHGPFYVGSERRRRGGGFSSECPTHIQVQEGDTIMTQSSGLISVGPNFLGLGDWVVDADGDAGTPHSAFPAPSLRRYSLICKISGSSIYFQGGVCQLFSAPASGELILDINDDYPENNKDNWTVFVSHTTAGDSAPQCGLWHFDTVAGAGGILGAKVGYSSAAVILGDNVHVFYHGSPITLGPAFHDNLRHVVLYHDLTQYPAYYTRLIEEDLDSGITSSNRYSSGQQVSSTVWRKTIHVFHPGEKPRTLRHGFANDESSWVFEVVDGDGGSDGEVNDRCGDCSATVVFRKKLHVFYSALTSQMAWYLRHAVLEGNTWKCETLDGKGGADGQLDASVGSGVSTIVDTNDVLHVFYHDEDNTNLRHAWWDEQNWRFEILDGSGDPDPDDPPIGQTRAHVGAWPTSAIFNSALYVFYYDESHGNVRCATFDNGMWSFERLDGGGGRNGRIKSRVGDGFMTTAIYSDQLSLFYYDSSDGNLRHAWKKTGLNWFFDTLDGAGGDQGRIHEDVGGSTSAVVQHFTQRYEDGTSKSYDVVHLFYLDDSNLDLRYANWF
jgi:hypothetical protein